jgi:hypothetical protein
MDGDLCIHINQMNKMDGLWMESPSKFLLRKSIKKYPFLNIIMINQKLMVDGDFCIRKIKNIKIKDGL